MELIVAPEAAGQRLDRYLAVHAGSRAQAQRLIEEGCVLVNGRPARKNERIFAGAAIRLLPRSAVEFDGTLTQAPFEIRYEDEALLVVDKPAGVVVHPAGGHRTGTLSQALAAYGAAGGEPCARASFTGSTRTPRGCSWSPRTTRRTGVCAGARLARDRARVHRARRRQAAVAVGDDRRADRARSPYTRPISIDTDDPRAARTHFELIEALPRSSLLRVRLETGRTHQIRAHFEAIGHPLRGDQQYGRIPLADLRRQFLHAAHLAFAQPFSAAPIDVLSPLPAELELALAAAREG